MSAGPDLENNTIDRLSISTTASAWSEDPWTWDRVVEKAQRHREPLRIPVFTTESKDSSYLLAASAEEEDHANTTMLGRLDNPEDALAADADHAI